MSVGEEAQVPKMSRVLRYAAPLRFTAILRQAQDLAQDAFLVVECGRGKGKSIKHAEWPKAVSKHAVVSDGCGLGISRFLRYAAPLCYAATQDAFLSMQCS